MPVLRETLNLFELRDNTLIRDVKPGPADRITLEIGDSKEPSQFIPQAKVSRWDNEVNLSVRRVKSIKGVATVDVRGNHVVFEDAEEEVHIYEKPEIDEDGGLEIELHLKNKPATNRFDFSIRTKGLDFYYQPPLTPEEVANGDVRPAPVVGSYAVYHSTKRNNLVGGKEYKTGKFCHIYRPHITDANGNETWGELEIDVDAEILTVVVTQQFLDTATYPVIVDPTIGYATLGATSAGFSNTIIASAINAVTDSDGGKVTEVVAGLSATGIDRLVTCAVYTSSGVLLSPISEEKSIDNPKQWVTFLFSNGPELSPSTAYRPAFFIGGNTVTTYRDNSSISGASVFNLPGAGVYPSFPNPVSFSGTTQRYSVYATYEISSSGANNGFMVFF